MDGLTAEESRFIDELFEVVEREPLYAEAMRRRLQECACDGPHCRNCGCCQHQGCAGGCIWAEEDLCSQCARVVMA